MRYCSILISDLFSIFKGYEFLWMLESSTLQKSPSFRILKILLLLKVKRKLRNLEHSFFLLFCFGKLSFQLGNVEIAKHVERLVLICLILILISISCDNSSRCQVMEKPYLYPSRSVSTHRMRKLDQKIPVKAYFKCKCAYWHSTSSVFILGNRFS